MEIKSQLKKKISHKLGTTPPHVQQTKDQDQSILSNSFLHKTIHKVGHDLRSPLFVVRAYANLLQKTQEREIQERGFKMMEDATFKMEHIINELVGLIDIYTLPLPEKEMISFEDSFEKTCLALINLTEQYPVKITTNFKATPEVFFDENNLTEILVTFP